MNVSKCSYSIFCNSANTEKDFVFRLNGQIISRNKNPKFLGVTFDEQLCFNKQVEEIKLKCTSRLNILKIISHPSWKLNKSVLTNIYKALIGSVIDYNFPLLSCFSASSLKDLQVIQNNSVRIIFKVARDSHTTVQALCEMSGLKLVEDRLKQLFSTYLTRNVESNQLLKGIVDDFLCFKRNKQGLGTPLCMFEEELLAFGESSFTDTFVEGSDAG